jgi:hypothetical protein
MSEPEVVDVYVAANGPQAHFLRGLLEDAGIEAQVVGDALQAAGYNTVTLPHLWVRAEQAKAARDLLRVWEGHANDRPSEDRPPPTWVCPTCRSEVDADFELCWQCQTPRKPY